MTDSSAPPLRRANRIATRVTGSRSRIRITGCATRTIRTSRTRRSSRYLEAENRYFEPSMAPASRARRRRCSRNSRRANNPTKSSLPWKDGATSISGASQTDAQYRIWLRWPVGKPDEPQTSFSTRPALAAGLDYFALGGSRRQPERALSRVATDTDGSERFTVHVKDLAHRRVARRHADAASPAASCGPTTTRRCSTSS